MRILITGGAGFMGSAACRFLVRERGATVLAIDLMTQTSNRASLDAVAASPRFATRRFDLCDEQRLAAVVHAFAPDAVLHLAGTGLSGHRAGIGRAVTRSLLEAVSGYWAGLQGAARGSFRFVLVSRTSDCSDLDELVLQRGATDGVPVVVARTGMVFGPCQPIDAMIPRLILAAQAGLPMAIESHGEQTSDAVHVDACVRAFEALIAKGVSGTTYEIGSGVRRTDLEIAERICQVMDRYAPEQGPHAELVQFVANATGPGERRPIDGVRIASDTDWGPTDGFDNALAKTVHWYLDNRAWWQPLYDARTDAALLGLKRSA